MTKKEFVKSLADKLDISQRDGLMVVDAFLSSVEEALVNHGGVSFVGWGSFSISKRDSREGRNPRTGAPIKIAASKVVKFKAGEPLKKAVNK